MRDRGSPTVEPAAETPAGVLDDTPRLTGAGNDYGFAANSSDPVLGATLGDVALVRYMAEGAWAGFWIGLQADYDRETTRDAMAKTLAGITPWRRSAPTRRPAGRARAAGRG